MIRGKVASRQNGSGGMGEGVAEVGRARTEATPRKGVREGRRENEEGKRETEICSGKSENKADSAEAGSHRVQR